MKCCVGHNLELLQEGTERPNMYNNLSLENQAALLNIFTIDLYLKYPQSRKKKNLLKLDK